MGRTQRERQRLSSKKTYLSDTEAADYIPQLYKYMNEQSWTNETQLTVKNYELSGRGICSKRRTFSNGDILIRLPLKSLISIVTLESNFDFKKQFNMESITKEQRVPFQCLMAFYLLYQQHLNTASSIQAYLQTIPSHFNMPYFCPLTELQRLPEAILEKTVEQNRKIRESFAILQTCFTSELCSCCGRKYFDDIYTLNGFKWAYFAVNSRSVYIDSRFIKPAKCYFQALLSDNTNLVLAPFLDLFNHAADVRTAASLERNCAKQYEFVLTLLQLPVERVEKYAQIFISYGALTNLKLLTDYGFVIAHNMHDYFEFSLHDIENFIKYDNSQKQRSFYSSIFKFIREHNLHDQMFVHASDGISHNLHVVLHLIFKEQNNFRNMLSQVAYGSVDLLQDVDDIMRLLIAFKIVEYQGFIDDLNKLDVLSKSGGIAIDYMQECIRYLKACLEII